MVAILPVFNGMIK